MSRRPPPPPPPPPAQTTQHLDRPAYGPVLSSGGFPGWAVGVMVAGGVVIAGSIAAFLMIGRAEEEQAVPRPNLPLVDTLEPGVPAGGASPIEDPPSTLRDLPPKSVGGFELVTVEASLQFAQSLDASEAVETQYINADGADIRHNIALYPSRTEATDGRGKLLGGFEKIGYVTEETNRERGINVTRLSGPKEALVWTNGVILATVEGPPEVTTQFYLDLPY
jgi:hypothetical protein